MTPFQRQVLVEEFARQNEQEKEMMPDEALPDDAPQTMSGGRRNQRHKSANSKKQAIKESQEETEKFVNTSVVDNE